jgi:hypothetical protein
MKLFNAQSKKPVNAVTALEDKILGFESLNYVAGGIMVIKFPEKPVETKPSEETETKYV